MAEFASAIIGPVVESLMVPVKKHMGYLFLSTKRVRDMSDRMKQLDGAFNDVKNHKDRNDINTLEIPSRVPGWLEEVAKIKGDVETISSNENACLNIKARYQMGRNAWKTAQKIERLLQEGLAFSWTNAQKPLGRVYTRRTSMSEPLSDSGIGEDFQSRVTTLKDALKFLQQDQKTRLIALCGMGGVGKTTMMEQLKKVVEDKKMFDWIVKVVIGKKPNWYSIQNAIAENLGNPLTEEIETTRADRLHKRFEETLKKSQNGILVILDDVWEKVELRDLGLSSLPNGVKLLLTSRYEDICKKLAIQCNLVFAVLKVNVLEYTEAHHFFCQITNISKQSDPELYQIGGDIVKKCSCLPLAIKLIAPTLISEEKSIWKDSLRRLRNNDLDQNVHEIIKISYDYLKHHEYKEIFLLCGLFPEDSNIPIEDLIKYAWGLNLLNGVSTVEDGRNNIKTCVSNLKKANLLIDGDYVGHVKMHDLVLAFVLAIVSKGDHASIINHGNMLSSISEDMRNSCKRISLTSKGMCEFHEGFKYPNLSLLKLMHGDHLFKFPPRFYENTKNLKVLAYEKMEYPLLPRSLQCSPALRVLHLHQCSLMFDCSFIGDLLNLEVLSITYCNIRKLSSTFGNLQKLKVLDLTGCVDLLIDDGVLKRLVKLEELYLVARNGSTIRSIDSYVDELVGCSENLTALAITLNALPKNLSFKKLERFKISLGCNFSTTINEYRNRFENTLRLVTNKCEILEPMMAELFEKTEVLHLQVKGVNDPTNGLAEFLHHRRSFFHNLRVLNIRRCANLRYLFTGCVANGLMKLEHLTISFCPVLETVVDGEKSGVGVIKFQALKFLSLGQLPKLTGLCNIIDVIELPQLMKLKLNGLPNFTSIYPLKTSSTSIIISERQSFLNREVMIPKLEKLHILNMQNLKEVWPREFSINGEVNVCILREINVEKCDNLVNLFPTNPMSLLCYLQELTVEDCGSIEVLFNIDLGCIIEETSCCLRRIKVKGLSNLREVIKGANDVGLLISGFQALESLQIIDCKRFRNVFTPTTTSFDMRALTNLEIHCREGQRSIRQKQEVNEEISEVGDTISNVLLSSNLIHAFHNVRTLGITKHERAEVVFEIESSSSRDLTTTPHNSTQQLLPYLKDLKLEEMECMSHVWKCNWNKFLIIPQNQQSFHNLTTISLWECNNIKHLFSPLMAKLLSNLKNVNIDRCDVIEEVVSNRDDEDVDEDEELVASTSTNTNTGFFPHMDQLNLTFLPNFKRIGGGSKEISSTTLIHDQSKLPQVNDVSNWSLCQYSRVIKVDRCKALPYVIPSYAPGKMQKLEELEVYECESLMEVFETQRFNINGEGSGGNDTQMVIQRMKKINEPQLSNLKVLIIIDCGLLQHLVTFSALQSLAQLEKLKISNCKAMKVIVKEDDGEQTMISSKVVVFSRLKSIELINLPNLTGFFLGKNEFKWPLLDDVMINTCPRMTVFTFGLSITPNLSYIRTKSGKYSLECGLNFPMMAATLHEIPFSSLDTTNSCSTILEGIHSSFHNLIEKDVRDNLDIKKIIPSNELLQLQKLEKIHVNGCDLVEEVFEALEGAHSSTELQFVVEIPKLTEVELKFLHNLKYIWKNNPWMVLEFPNLTKLSIFLCNSLEHVFSSSMVGSLLQLQDLKISHCKIMKVIVKETNVVVEELGEGECDDKVNEIIMLPRLKTLTLIYLSSLEGFFLGKAAFSWPSLDTLKIEDCLEMRVFTMGHSTTPELKVIDTSFGRFELVMEQDLNSFIINNTPQRQQPQQQGLKLGEMTPMTMTTDSTSTPVTTRKWRRVRRP